MANTRIDFKGLDITSVASSEDSKLGTRNDLVMTPNQTKLAIDYNIDNNTTIGYTAGPVKTPFLQVNAVSPANFIDILGGVPFSFSDMSSNSLSENFSKRIDSLWAPGSNTGCLDIGLIQSNKTYYVYAIYNPTSDTTDILISLSATSPIVPSGYTKRTRIGRVYTSATTSSIAGVMVLIDSNGTLDFYYEYNSSNALISYVIVNQSANASFTFDTTTGDIIASGNVTAYSDEKLKTNILPIDSALDKILSLNGLYYTKGTRKEIGFIAQEVEKIIPEVIATSGDLKSVSYGNLVALLVEGIKELSDRVSHLEQKDRLHHGKLGG